MTALLLTPGSLVLSATSTRWTQRVSRSSYLGSTMRLPHYRSVSRFACELGEKGTDKPPTEDPDEYMKVVPPTGLPTPPSEPEAIATTVFASSLGLQPRTQSGPYNFKDIMRFDGLAPEITNGRVAMASYSIILLTEQFTGKGIAEQLSSGGWIGAIAIPVILSIASLVPSFKGYRNDDWPGIGPFTAKAERWNSRACMFALTVLAIVEAVKGGPEVGSGPF